MLYDQVKIKVIEGPGGAWGGPRRLYRVWRRETPFWSPPQRWGSSGGGPTMNYERLGRIAILKRSEGFRAVQNAKDPRVVQAHHARMLEHVREGWPLHIYFETFWKFKL